MKLTNEETEVMYRLDEYWGRGDSVVAYDFDPDILSSLEDKRLIERVDAIVPGPEKFYGDECTEEEPADA